MEDGRPDPEKLLKQAEAEERQKQQGKLKIYLGAAPGVGKTYTMLHDAIGLREKGLDIVVGVAESHGRQEIDALLKDLEILPRQEVDYHQQKLSEFDLDGALKRNPGLILMDEMAHSNAPGLRHTKRWQDIKELLDRGIDVYTTLNVQHVESRSDVAAQIIHAQINETVPDSMLEIAETIELVDLPPEDLLKRLQEGKVYFAPQVELAKEYFFQKGNLIALREIALRITAERVGAQVFLYRQGQGIRSIWPTTEKILVCVGPGTESIRLIRAARRTATSLQAEWIAVHVNAPKLHLTEKQQNNAVQNLHLAQQLGAQTYTLIGNDLVQEILTFAHEQNITQIVVGKTIRPAWKEFFFRSFAYELVRHSGDINVYIVTGKAGQFHLSKHNYHMPKIAWGSYWIAIGTIVLATAVNFYLYPYVDVSNLMMVYLLGVLLIALFGRIGPSILASVLSVLAYGFFFIPTFHGFKITDIKYFLTLLMMLLVTQVISHLTILSRKQAAIARRAEHRTATLYTLSQQLATTRGVNKLLETAVRYISELFDSEILALMPEDSHLVVKASYRTDHALNVKERSIAQWVYDLGQMAGLGTDTLPSSDALYVPLRATNSVIGVLCLRPTLSQHLFSPDQIRLLEACTNQIALGIEVDQLQERTENRTK